MSAAEAFSQWCIVELFGHSMIAGLVGEQQIGGSSFVRVDVPATNGRDAYTKFFGPGAIYAMTPVDEETCRKAISNMTRPPVELYHFRSTVPQIAPRDGDNDDWDDES